MRRQQNASSPSDPVRIGSAQQGEHFVGGSAISLSASSIAEGSANGAAVGTASISGTTTGVPSWSISDADTTFAIDGTTGVITVADNTDLVHATHPTISVTVSVSGTTPSVADLVTNITITSASADDDYARWLAAA